MSKKPVEKNEVKNFWSDHPLGSYEQSHRDGIDDFFEFHDKKRDKIRKYIDKLLDFEKNKGKAVIELGCGPGNNVKRYAVSGAKIAACDISTPSVKIAKIWLQKLNLDGCLCVADLEYAPFKSEYFDFILCDGVLHHTPGIERGLNELYRILKLGGRGVVSVYYENILLRPYTFPITKFFLWVMRFEFLGGRTINLAMSLEEFGKLYDGVDNVLGKIYSKNEFNRLVTDAGFKIEHSQLHFFPILFIPGGKFIPSWFTYILDRIFGTMIYFQVSK